MEDIGYSLLLTDLLKVLKFILLFHRFLELLPSHQKTAHTLVLNYCSVDVSPATAVPTSSLTLPQADLFPRVEELVVRQARQWSFNAFQLWRLARGRSLPTLCLHIFHTEGHSSLISVNP